MKLRSVFLLTAIVSCLLSCVEEELIQIAPEREKVTIGIDISPSEIISKAIVENEETGEVSYDWATAEELKVNKCFIGIFNADGDLVGYKNASEAELVAKELGENDQNIPTGTLPAYHIDMQTKTGNGMKLMAIANSEHTLPGDLKTYDAFAKLVEDNKSSTFEAGNLVKFGVRSVNIEPKANQVFTVAMRQLAAKIILDVEAKVADDIQMEPKYYFDDFLYDEETVTDWGKGEKTPPGNINYRTVDPFDITTAPDRFLWYKDQKIKVTNNGGKILLFENTANLVKEEEQWYFDIAVLKILNIETKSETILETKTMDAALKDKEIVDPNNMNITFYTYEKPDDTENPIRINFEGQLKKGIVTTKQEVKGESYAIWVKKGNPLTPWIVPEEMDGGWGNEGYALIAFNKEFKGDPVGVPIPDGVVIKEYPSSKYALIIAPKKTMAGCNTDGVIHGNLYHITATVQPTLLHEVTLDWIVNPWISEPEVNIPFN